MVLRFGQRNIPFARACPIDHADVVMRIGDAVNIEEARGDQGDGSGLCGRRAFADQFNFEAALFKCFAECGLLRVFIEFDMATNRKPLVELSMVHQEDLAGMDNKDSDCEIDLVMNMRHGGRTLERNNGFVNIGASLVGNQEGPGRHPNSQKAESLGVGLCTEGEQRALVNRP